MTARFPKITKAGVYKNGGWRYELATALEGTKSERMHGRLFRDGEELTGESGDRVETPLATFVFISRSPWQFGWLSTLSTTGSPMFDEQGQLTRWARHAIATPIQPRGGDPGEAGSR